MSGSSDSESSDSSNDFMVPPDKLELESSFFKKAPPKQKAKPVVESSDESEFDYEGEVQSNNADLMAQVLKNLENSQRTESLASTSNVSTSSEVRQPAKELSNEIADLLRQGESGSTASTSNQNEQESEEEPAEVSAPAGYTIPEGGVKVTLTDNTLIFRKQKSKKEQDMETVLKNRLNQQLRSNQVLLHKVGLLCWLAHGFYVNKQINNPILLSACLELAPKNCHPKGRVDLNYLEKITKWFKNIFTETSRKPEEAVTTLALLKRLKTKEIRNYRELVALYVAMLRSLGLTCRLVISLQPPALKVSRDQLIGSNSEVENKDTTKPGQDKRKKTEPTSKRGRPTKQQEKKEKEDEKPVMSTRLRQNTEAKKRAIEILKRKHDSVEESSNEEKPPVKKLATTSRSTTAQPSKNDNFEEPKTRGKSEPAKTSKRLAAKIAEIELSKEKVDDDSKTSNSQRKISTRLAAKIAKSEPVKKDDDDDYDDDKSKVNDILRGKKIKLQLTRFQAKTEQKPLIKEEHDEKTRVSVVPAAKTSTRLAAKIAKNILLKKDTNDTRSTKSRNTRLSTRLSGKIQQKSARDDDDDFEEDDDDDDYKDDEDEENDDEEDEEDDDFKEEDDDDDDDFVQKKVARSRGKSTSKASTSISKLQKPSAGRRTTSTSRKLLSEDSDNEDIKPAKIKNGKDLWVEVYVESEENWISVSVTDGKIHCNMEIYKNASDPVLYVMAWNSEGYIKDVTRRYCPHWLTVTRKQRVDEKWWLSAHTPWQEPETVLSKAEDEMLKQKELEQPLPKTVSECKGHPLYVLPRHLLKFEALYPTDVVPLGYVRGEPIYSRHCVHTLCSRETWVKQARVVKPGEKPYKTVKARPKYDKLSGVRLNDEPLEVFGKWQTDQYVPPEAKNGIIPRNEYGNVDLFKQCMLPKGTVHIKLPGLNRVARKLDIDCCPAVVGFNFGGKGALPAFDGFIICQEFEDVLREAWEVEQRESEKRAIEKYEKRVYGNWRKLIKAALIRERLKIKYGFELEQKSSSSNKGVKQTKRVGKKAKANN